MAATMRGRPPAMTRPDSSLPRAGAVKLQQCFKAVTVPQLVRIAKCSSCGTGHDSHTSMLHRDAGDVNGAHLNGVPGAPSAWPHQELLTASLPHVPGTARHNLDTPNSPFRTFDDEESAAQIAKANSYSSSISGTKPQLKYETIMLKVSGEALQGALGFGVDAVVMRAVAEEVRELVHAGVKVAIVVGGGNYFRGANAWQGLDRATADYVGMMATVMNALQLQGALEGLGVDTRVQTAIEMREVAEPYIRRRAVAHLQAGRVVIFGAGTGNPFFTTDTAAALRAAEINAQVLIKATKVDGIYDSDPFKNPHAKKYNKLSYRQCTNDSLRIMDETAITLCKENNIPVLVLNMTERGVFLKAARGEAVGTVVCEQLSDSESE